MTERGTVGAALVLLATSIAAPARGQDGEQGPAAGGVPAQTVERAAALFERGLADMLAKRFASGCPTLAASYRTNPLPGTLFTLAECYAYWKRPATAMPLYRDFLSRVASMEPKQQDKQAERVQVARSQLAALEGRVAWLTISPASELPDGSVVLLDGIPVAPSLLGEPLAVDPGRRRVRAELSDGRVIERTIAIEAGERDESNLRLDDASSATSAGAPESWHCEVAGGSLARSMAWASAGVGVTALAFGAVAGGLAVGEAGTVEDHCTGGDCDAEGKSAADRAKTLATASDVGLAVGLAGVAAATVLWLVAPGEPGEPTGSAQRRWQPTGTVGRDGAGLGIWVAW